MKKKKFSPLWLIPAVVIVALILWCIHFPMTRIAGFSKSVEPLHATVFFDQVPEAPTITYATDDPEQLRELAEQLRSVRGRFMGWFTSITYNDDPLLHLIVVGTKGNKEYSLSLSADSDGYIYIQRKHTQLRTNDTALYDYLTELAEKGRKGAAAKEVAANYVEKLSRVIYLYEDIDLSESTVLVYGYAPEMQYVVEKSEELKARRVEEGHFRTNWGSMYGTDVVEISEDSATVLVTESISFRYEDVDFDSGMGNEYTVTLKKLNGEWLVSSVEGGDTYSLKEMELYTGEAQAPTHPVGAYDDPNAVFTAELKPSSELKQIEVLINEEYLVCIDDPDKVATLSDMFLNATPIPYAPKTFVHDATIYFEYTDGTITPVTSFLSGNLYVLNDSYYNFAFRENGESLTIYTGEVMYDLLDMANWDDAAKEKYRDTLNYFFVEKR